MIKVLRAAAILTSAYWLGLNIYTGFGSLQNHVWLLISAALAAQGELLNQYRLQPKRIPLWLVASVNTTACFGILVLLIIQLMILAAGRGKQTDGLDYIIVLGAGMQADGSPSRTMKQRLDRAAEYLENNKDTMLVLSGGQGDDEPVTEAEAMADYLIGIGVNPENIYLEIQSKNTRENIIYSKALISRVISEKRKQRKPFAESGFPGILIADERPQRIGILTSNYHIFRAMLLAEEIGFKELYALPADSDLFYYLHMSLRESIAVLKDKFMGYI